MNALNRQFTSLKSFIVDNDVQEFVFVDVPAKKLEDGTTRPAYRLCQFADSNGEVISFGEYPDGDRQGQPMPFSVGLSKELTKKKVKLSEDWIRQNAKALQIAYGETESGRDSYSFCMSTAERVSIDMSMFD